MHKHHHHICLISLLPIVLLLLAPEWGRARMAPTIEEYRTLAERAEQKMELLDAKFSDVQRAQSLLQEGEAVVRFPSVAEQHRKTPYYSSAERYDMARIRNTTLNQRIAALQSSIRNVVDSDQIVHIDLSDQQASLIEEGAIIARYPVSSGAWETPTPKGTFQIHRKQTLRVSQQEVPYRMPYYMEFTKSESHGLHALPYLGDEKTNSDFWHEARDHIGIPVSHGCVRFLPEDAETVFEWISVGTPVLINT